MRTATPTRPGRRSVEILGVIISLIALADGALHLSLDYVMFHGRLWGSFHPSGPPPGGPPGGALPGGHAGPPPGPHFSLPLPNNELFILNAIGYVVLVVLFWLGDGVLGRWRWLIDAAIAVYAAFSIWAWLQFGAPNPDGLGYTAKALEAVLIVCVAIHAWYVTFGPGARSRGPIELRESQPVR